MLVVQGDARRLPLPDVSADLIVTSPPYFALRSYTDGGEHYAGQIGSEPTPAAYIAELMACTREWVRVLKPSGSIMVNLGDKYSTGNGGRPKSLLGLPWRYALACVDQLGLILRAEIIWSKPNGLPESVTDRVRRSHEQWFHFTVQPRYYAAVDEIREASSYQRPNDYDRGLRGGVTKARTFADSCNPLGKLPGSVWSIPSEPLTVPDHLGVDHFAAFPTEWPRRLILGWSPPGVCTACGEGRRPVADVEYKIDSAIATTDKARRSEQGNTFATRALGRAARSTTITGYACACPEPTAPTRPAVVLDPFGGTGTTALCASVLGRIGISVDMSADYSKLARWRTTNETQRVKASRVKTKAPTAAALAGAVEAGRRDGIQETARRVLDRHKCVDDGVHAPWCSWCRSTDADWRVAWPCADAREAQAALVDIEADPSGVVLSTDGASVSYVRDER